MIKCRHVSGDERTGTHECTNCASETLRRFRDQKAAGSNPATSTPKMKRLAINQVAFFVRFRKYAQVWDRLWIAWVEENWVEKG